jgi:hypothetical protein
MRGPNCNFKPGTPALNSSRLHPVLAKIPLCPSRSPSSTCTTMERWAAECLRLSDVLISSLLHSTDSLSRYIACYENKFTLFRHTLPFTEREAKAAWDMRPRLLKRLTPDICLGSCAAHNAERSERRVPRGMPGLGMAGLEWNQHFQMRFCQTPPRVGFKWCQESSEQSCFVQALDNRLV